MALNKKTIFLLDGSGAAASALLTGFVLPYFSSELGLPPEVLYSLATLPALCLLYSFSCYFRKEFHPWMLSGIITANTFYCLISAGLIAFFAPLTVWGAALLALEIFVVVIVIALEIKVYRRSFAVKSAA